MGSNIFQRYRKLILFFIVVIFLIFTISSLRKPFIIDELVFVTSAENWISEGKPLLYTGELDKGNLMFYHPPLYLYLLTLSFKIFGVSEVSARIFGVLFSLLTLFIVYFLSLEIFKKRDDKYFIALLASLVYSTSPFVIQSSLLVDIDGTILTFLMTLFIYFFVKKKDCLNLKNLFFLGLLLSLILWTKLQGAFFILVSIFIYYLLDRKILKSIKNTFFIGITGIFIFIITWCVYSIVFNAPFFLPFKHNFGFFNNYGEASPLQTIFLIIWSGKNLLFWTTPPFFIMILLILIKRIVSYLKLKKLSNVDFLLIYGSLIIVFFTLVQQTAYGFPKYFIPVMPTFSVLIGNFIADFKFKNDRKLMLHSIFLIMILMLFNFFILKDPFIEHNIFFTKSITLQDNLEDYLFYNIKGLIFFLPFIITFLYFLVLKYKPYGSLILSSIIVLLVTCIYINYVQLTADYNTIYAYGQKGTLEAAQYIAANTKAGDVIISQQSIAYYSNRKFYMSYPPTSDFLDQFDTILKTQDIPFIVVSPSEKLPDLSERYKFDGRIGHFMVYERVKNV